MKRFACLTAGFWLLACSLSAFDFNQGVGLQATVPGVVVPVVSYWKAYENNIFTRGEAGFTYDGTHTVIMLEVNGFNNFYENFYAGAGFSATYINNALLFGICNPSVGFMFDIWEGLKGFLETSVMIVSLRKLPENGSMTLVTEPVYSLKAGVTYLFK